MAFKLRLEIQGDVTICVYHGRSTLGGKVQGKLTSIPMFQLQFHTGFVGVNAKKMVFIKYVNYKYSIVNITHTSPFTTKASLIFQTWVDMRMPHENILGCQCLEGVFHLRRLSLLVYTKLKQYVHY